MPREPGMPARAVPGSGRRAILVAALAGLLPILAAHGAYVLNLLAGALGPDFVCLPYTDGCVSISRAARSGPGLWLFRSLMLPSAVLLFLLWRSLPAWLTAIQGMPPRRVRAMTALGLVGAVFLVFYVTALGQDGSWYQWQRRYGVVLYFGGTALAQLLLVWLLQPRRRELGRPAALLSALVGVQWILGVFSALKRLLFADPVFIDRLENLIEWWYALAMSLAFLALAWLLARRGAVPSAPAQGSPA